jgi:hypothetical protein
VCGGLNVPIGVLANAGFTSSFRLTPPCTDSTSIAADPAYTINNIALAHHIRARGMLCRLESGFV